MQKTSLTALAREELAQALTLPSGRTARTVFGGHEHQLRQTVVAMRAGETQSEHESPGEATIHVLHGRVLLSSGDDSWSGWVGDLLVVPANRHSLTAVENCAFLLTVVKDL
jgi:quercetin dioxygenase-like cupin family protein